MTTLTLTLPLYLYADIETLPSQDPQVMREIIAKHATEPPDESTIKPAANLKNPELVAADLEKRLEKARADHVALVDKTAKATDEEYRRTALDATSGHIACISFAMGDTGVLNVQNDCLTDIGKMDLSNILDGERSMLRDFFWSIERMLLDRALAMHVDDMPIPCVVAHHAQFDVRYIWQRCIILGVPVPSWWPIDAKPWDADRVDDTMTAWAGHGNRIGLDRLCRALGIPGKPHDIDGSKVWDAVREGRIGDVVTYCDGDVERLRAVHRRIRGITGPFNGITTRQAAIEEIGFDPEMFEAAEAAADAARQAEIDDMPDWDDGRDRYSSRGFNADGGSYNAVNNE